MDNITDQNLPLLRFTTAGSVDDGKSTLIGRLLFDSKAIFEDQLEAMEQTSKRKGEEHLNLALLTDGLKAEREQGITIDVAYRYFATPKRKFIIADTPGHIQYTRNMVTGASTAHLAIILIDARNGILEQTIRHSYIASLLGIKYIVACVNKMDLVHYSSEVFYNIQTNFQKIADKLSLANVQFIPISALNGDNVVEKSGNTPWYQGPSLLHLLETIEIINGAEKQQARFPVQYVIRPNNDKYHDYRGYAGQMAGGTFSTGDEVLVLPTGLSTKIAGMDSFEGEIAMAGPMQSVVIRLEDDIDVSRGNMLVNKNHAPKVSQEIEAMVCWFNPRPLQPGMKYIVRQTTNEVRAAIKSIDYQMDINSLEHMENVGALKLNDIGKVSFKTSKALFYDSYNENRYTGGFIFIDETTNETMGAGMILD